MKKPISILLTIVSAAAGAYIFWRRFGVSRQMRPIEKENLYYSHLSVEELKRRHLIDLNGASPAELNALGLDSDSLQRVIDNRPYRSKLDLVSRMIISEDVYAALKDKIGVTAADEVVKIA